VVLPPDEDPVRLRKKVTELEKEVEGLNTLVSLLRALPSNRERRNHAPSAKSPKGSTTGRKNPKRRKAVSRVVPTTDRSAPARAESPAG
jgi:hypothetical protein